MEIEDESSDMKAGRLGRNTDNKLRSMSRSRSQGAKKVLNETETRMNNLRKKMQKDLRHSFKNSEADRRIPCEMPKHLYTGSRGIGKTDYR